MGQQPSRQKSVKSRITLIRKLSLVGKKTTTKKRFVMAVKNAFYIGVSRKITILCSTAIRLLKTFSPSNITSF